MSLKLSHLNNCIHSWLDDHELVKLLCLFTVVIGNNVILVTSWPVFTPIFASLAAFLLVFVSRFAYITKGHYIKPDQR